MPLAKHIIAGLMAAVLFILPAVSMADESTRRYRTLEERRDAGQKHQITEWLQISPLIELEYVTQTLKPYAVDDFTHKENSKTLQLDVEITPNEWLMAEIVYEYDDELNEFVLDEAIAELEAGDFKLELGRQSVPFGEYYSRFITGPVLEFGETSARSIVMSYEPDDDLEVSLFIVKGKMEKDTVDDDSMDWGLSINLSATESMTTGISYLSDLSETDEELLEDSLFYHRRVDAISAYANFEFENFETSIEWLRALDSFSELDADRDQPSAWNLELALYLNDIFEIGLRIEGSKELEDAAERQAGIAMTIHAIKNMTATIEFLRARFKPGLAEDRNGNELENQNQLVAQIGLSF